MAPSQLAPTVLRNLWGGGDARTVESGRETTSRWRALSRWAVPPTRARLVIPCRICISMSTAIETWALVSRGWGSAGAFHTGDDAWWWSGARRRQALKIRPGRRTQAGELRGRGSSDEPGRARLEEVASQQFW